MKRMKVLFGNRRMMVLLTLAILVLAATALVASSASFTATSANPGNAFTAGSLIIDNSLNDEANHTEAAILTMSLMKPGDSKSGSVTITNVGTLAGDFTMTKSRTAGSAAFGDELHLVITDGAAPFYDGTLDGFLDGTAVPQDNTVSLGNWIPGASHTYNVTVDWPTTDPADDNDFMGATCTYRFQWDAVQ